MRAELERQRDQDRPFKLAWLVALRVALDGLRGIEHREWHCVFVAMRDVWESSYLGLPSTASASLSTLAMCLPDDERVLA